jgi:peroxiredoxin Q/BCP
MPKGGCIVRVTALVLVLLLFALPAAALEAGDKAPEFEADSTEGTIRLSDYAGKKHVVLAFYFKDFTGG